MDNMYHYFYMRMVSEKDEKCCPFSLLCSKVTQLDRTTKLLKHSYMCGNVLTLSVLRTRRYLTVLYLEQILPALRSGGGFPNMPFSGTSVETDGLKVIKLYRYLLKMFLRSEAR